MQVVPRTSRNTRVINKTTHHDLLPQYLEILDGLENAYPVFHNDEYSQLVNFEKNKKIPIHRWFYYKQGYSNELVKKLILDTRTNKSQNYVLDPFCGVGTTLVSAQSLGIKSIGLEINPIASFTSEVKTMIFSHKEILKIKIILENIRKLLFKSNVIPKYKKLKNIFTTLQLKQILKIKGFYENLEDPKIQKFFKLAYISIIEDCSNRIKDGNGIKISKNKPLISNIIEYYIQKCELMFDDLFTIDKQSDSITIQGSILQDSVFAKLKKYKINSIIFSPPYANCFDYCEVNKMEIWMGDFVQEYDDFNKFRKIAIRSHVNSKFNHEIHHHNHKSSIIASLIGTYNIWNKNIPDMLKGYFDDMEEVLKRLYQILERNGHCFIVVANSSYKGIIVPTDLLLTDIAKHVGFTVKNVVVARQMRSSPQQASKFRNKTHLMRESIITLIK